LHPTSPFLLLTKKGIVALLTTPLDQVGKRRVPTCSTKFPGTGMLLWEDEKGGRSGGEEDEKGGRSGGEEDEEGERRTEFKRWR
jgi:hypothetical protein